VEVVREFLNKVGESDKDSGEEMGELDEDSGEEMGESRDVLKEVEEPLREVGESG